MREVFNIKKWKLEVVWREFKEKYRRKFCGWKLRICKYKVNNYVGMYYDFWFSF